MNTTDILNIRLYNQLLAGNEMKNPQDIVAYMGAMQSQTFDMARWAIGVRLAGSTDQMVQEALNNSSIIRIHILRPTWHFVAAEDIHWMIDLSMPRLRPAFTSYAKMLKIDEGAFKQIWPTLEKCLRDDNHLTRQELLELSLAEGHQVNANMIQLMLGFAETEGLVCNGRINGNKQTFCLLQERVARTQTLAKEEALEKLARRFFTSHAPATLEDFIWWSGLLASDCKRALELIKDDFVSEEINGRVFWMKNDIRIPSADTDSALLLPQFDEFVVSYKERSEMIDDRHYSKVMTKNGLFSPTIMFNGEIIGSWRKVMNKKKPEVEMSFFEKTPKKTKDAFKKIEKTYIEFLTGE